MSAKKTPPKASTPKAKPPQFGDTELRRPPQNPAMPQQNIEALNAELNHAKAALEEYAVHLSSRDRQRLNKVGIKKRGFVDRALDLAAESPGLLPSYLSFDKFRADDQYFTNFHTLHALAQQIVELLWNITVQASDTVYSDALKFYATANEAAKRRVDGAETIHGELEPFFKSMGARKKDENANGATRKKTKSDANALIDGKRDGRIVIENIRPKAAGGKHIVIDEQFRETEEEERGVFTT